MKRLHVHVSVEDIPQSIHFYTALFAAEPIVAKPDYAKWMLDDPRVNFAISTHGGGAPGVDHLGIQVEPRASCTKFTNGCNKLIGRSWKKVKQLVATPNQRNHGSPTRRACLGKRPNFGRKHDLWRQRRPWPNPHHLRRLLHAGSQA